MCACLDEMWVCTHHEFLGLLLCCVLRKSFLRWVCLHLCFSHPSLRKYRFSWWLKVISHQLLTSCFGSSVPSFQGCRDGTVGLAVVTPRHPLLFSLLVGFSFQWFGFCQPFLSFLPAVPSSLGPISTPSHCVLGSFHVANMETSEFWEFRQWSYPVEPAACEIAIRIKLWKAFEKLLLDSTCK